MMRRKPQPMRSARAAPRKWQGRKALVGISVVALAGCSADWYKRDADRQIYSILAQRKQQTLQYQPQAVAESTVKPQTPTPKSFKRVPVTPVPPPQMPPMEPHKTLTPFARLSPTP